MFDRKDAFLDLGRRVYGLAGMALGVIGLWWRDYAAVWQPIDNLVNLPDRTLLACAFALCELAAGTATLWRRTARIGLPTLAALHLISALGWLPRIAANLSIVGVWNGIFEQLALVAGGIVAYACLLPDASAWRAPTLRAGRSLFGICAVWFGLTHFTAIPEVVSFTPAWIPPGQLFWAWATGVFHVLAGVAILTGVQAVLASRLYVTMCVGFGVLVWAPILFAAPDKHFNWAGNAINLALVGAAWVIADSIFDRRHQRRLQQDRPPSDVAASVQ